MKRGLIFGTDSPGRAAALNVIRPTDCWQIVHYQRCTVDGVKPHTDRKGKCASWKVLGGVRSKEKLNWIVICCLHLRRLLCFDVCSLIGMTRKTYWPGKLRRIHSQHLRVSGLSDAVAEVMSEQGEVRVFFFLKTFSSARILKVKSKSQWSEDRKLFSLEVKTWCYTLTANEISY